jgi:hypothetical protein
MKPSVLASKDVWAGLFLIAVGATAMLMARNYNFGSSLRMGPGYFPTVLGGLLALCGLYLVVTGLRSSDLLAAGWPLRAIVLLPLSLVLFGLLIDRAGFVPAMMVLIFGSALAGTEFRFVEVLLFSIFMTALCTAVFIWALGLPYPLLAGF